MLEKFKLFFQKKFILFLLPFFIFFVPALYTIKDYNINWDEPEHFMRGQAYLRYFLTGERNYNKLPLFKESQFFFRDRTKKVEIKLPRYSIYQNTILDGEYYLTQATGHPPLNDILASTTNLIFFQKLGVLDDISSYHLFIVICSSFLVFLVFFWVKKEYGLFAALVASFSVSLYPLFFAESHSNIKDPVETFFFALTIYAFYKGITQKTWRWLIISSISFGFALGTKFNILFSPFIIIPWVFIYYGRKILDLRKFWFAFLAYPFIAFSIFFASYPYLWASPLKRTLEVFGYYKSIGSSVGGHLQPENFYIFGFNSYPLQTIFFTTPMIVLFLFFFGILYVFKRGFNEKNKFLFLILLWFIFPILRVTLPGSSIYSGVRQIMEFIPAMAILSGIGASFLVKQVSSIMYQVLRVKSKNKKKLISYSLCSLLILSFLPITIKLIQIHPNENVYFNPLIGGLKGAKEKNFPYWGSSLGTSYKQGVEWLNKNAEKNAKVAMVIATGQNVPSIFFREDLGFENMAWSATKRKGEYLIEAVFDGWIREWHYDGEYVDNVLKPVYEVKVDDVPILKVWKNDKEHTHPRFLKEKTMLSDKIKWREGEDEFSIDLEKEVDLMKISISYKANKCTPFKSGIVYLSQDGEGWTFEREPVRDAMIKDYRFDYPLVGKRAKYIKIILSSDNSCEYNVEDIKITYI